MTWQSYQDDCPGCEPAIIDVESGLALPKDGEVMKRVLSMWRTETTRPERVAWHRVTCQNSRNPADMVVAQSLAARISAVLHEGLHQQ